MNLKNAVAIITGASSGIGAAVARQLSEAGTRLVLTARRQQRLEELARQCQPAITVPGDITDPRLPGNLIDRALHHFGQCDIVFNNAGFMEVGSIDEIDLEKVCAMVRVNVEAAFRMAYVALRHFRKVGRGHLLNTSSILGTKIRPHLGAYAGTKYAIEALSEALRMELAGTGVKISCIQPGLVMTELHSRWPVHPKDLHGISHPLSPQDIARCVQFILEQPDHVNIARLLPMPAEQSL